ncbi:ABC transporter substrate-binding protein [Burkholderia sp. IMCC1007]|uniref:ABC transporter substrate-binding protein n=1 Tax=Burkholderia sp. IMCC1007 TaxID=3004104 RepID=UPI0022B47AF9|nr:ABC transporter substrate-binding protein [Burkholderia sp. IMCC1007]
MLMKRYAILTAIVAAGAAWHPAHAQSDNVVVRASGGGTFGEALRRICDEPFTKATGIVIQPANTDDSTAEIRAQMLTRNVIWDISNTSADTIFAAAKNGWLEKLDWSKIDPDNKLPALARNPYGVGINSYSETMVVRTDKLPPGKTMGSWADFWDLKTFPGPRSLHDTPVKNLEFALIADGVAPADVYKTLATKEGVDRALKKMDQIKPSIAVWWTSGQQPLQLLASGEVYYATAWNGRVPPLQKEGVPVRIVWNGGALMVGFHSILKGAKHTDGAYRWLKWCWTDPQRGADMTKALPYPGFAPGLMERLPKNLQSELPTYPDNLKVQFQFNGEFWADNLPRIQRAWDRWRLKGNAGA